MNKLLLPLCAALFLFPAFASAAPADSTPTVNEEGARVDDEGPVRELTFDLGDTVEGETNSPTGTNISSQIRQRHATLFTLRESFIPELIRLSNNI